MNFLFVAGLLVSPLFSHAEGTDVGGSSECSGKFSTYFPYAGPILEKQLTEATLTGNAAVSIKVSAPEEGTDHKTHTRAVLAELSKNFPEDFDWRLTDGPKLLILAYVSPALIRVIAEYGIDGVENIEVSDMDINFQALALTVTPEPKAPHQDFPLADKSLRDALSDSSRDPSEILKITFTKRMPKILNSRDNVNSSNKIVYEFMNKHFFHRGLKVTESPGLLGFMEFEAPLSLVREITSQTIDFTSEFPAEPAIEIQYELTAPRRPIVAE
jgi:hypothetical protein